MLPIQSSMSEICLIRSRFYDSQLISGSQMRNWTLAGNEAADGYVVATIVHMQLDKNALMRQCLSVLIYSFIFLRTSLSSLIKPQLPSLLWLAPWVHLNQIQNSQHFNGNGIPRRLPPHWSSANTSARIETGNFYICYFLRYRSLQRRRVIVSERNENELPQFGGSKLEPVDFPDNR